MSRGRVAQIARAAGAAVALLVLVVGVPVGLAVVAGWPLPHGLPDVGAVRRALEDGWSPDGTILIKAVAVVCWVAWAEVAACVVVELAAALSGRRRALKVPLGGLLQPFVARLVAAFLVANTIVIAHTGSARPPSLAAVVAEYRPVPSSLALISTAHASEPPPEANQPSARSTQHVLVQPRDDLWDLAEHHLGDPLRWREIWELNRDRLQPDGRRFTNPDLIRPSWVLDLPADAVDVEEAASPAEASVPASAAQSAPAKSPADSPPAMRTSLAEAGRPRSSTPSAPPVRGQPHRSARPVSIALPSGSVVAASFAAGVAAAVATGRLRRRRAYRPSPPGPAALERPHDVDPTTQVLLRSIPPATQCQTPASDGLPPFPLRGLHDPAPALVAVGTRGTEAVELDICSLGGLAVVGPGATDVVRALVAALLAKGGPYVTELVITKAAADELLSTVGAVAGVRLVPDVDAALTETEVELVHRTRLLEGEDVPDFAAYRQHSGDLMPALVVVTEAPRNGVRLRSICELGRRLGVGAIVCGSAEGCTARVDVDEAGTPAAVTPEALGSRLGDTSLYRLAEQEAAQLIGILAAARDEAPESTETAAVDQRRPEGTHEDEEARFGPAAAGTHVDVRLLGPLRISVDGEAIRKGLRGSARELLAYYLLRPQGATLEAAVDVLWPDADAKTGSDRFWTALGNLRSRLRTAIGGDHPLVKRDGEVYRVEDGVFDVDVWRFQAALAESHDHGGKRIEALERAVGAYGGDLLEGCFYEWAEPVRQELRLRALDTLVQLSELRKDRGDPEGALAAIEQAIAVDPYAEELYRRAITLLGELDRTDVARQVFRQLGERLRDLDVDPEDDTLAILEELSRCKSADSSSTMAPPTSLSR